MKYITRTVWILSLISLFTDTASEMLYPIMPIYLKSIGFSIVTIGILEGFAEAIAGLSKGYFGKLSDNLGKRVPFVRVGYALSSISKPMMAVFTYPLWIFFARTIDRIGKGIRTGARDAILSDEATPETKGKVFGFHRSMDTLGAAIGPTFALVYLIYHPQDYKTLFYLAFIPGLLSITASLYLKERSRSTPASQSPVSLFSVTDYWQKSPLAYRKLLIGLLAFTLFNSSDVFLLLQAKQSGLNDPMILSLYIFYNLVYALLAFPVGIIADRVGLKKIFMIGLALFAVVYLGMSFNTDLVTFFGLFTLYGIYAAATESISKAWISNIVDRHDTATAIGTFTGLQSIFTMMASSLAGLIWYEFGSTVMFQITAIVTVIVIVYFSMAVPYSENTSN